MENDLLVRFAIFLALFIVFAVLENYVPRRQQKKPRLARWRTNWGITLINSVTLRLLSIGLPLLAVGAAIDASNSGYGLFNHLGWSVIFEACLCILIMDFAIWAQHVFTHKIPILWRMHQVHHTDIEMDVTTAIRFHPAEIAISMLLKIGLVYLLGPSVWAVIIFEILLNGAALFNHANIKLPAPLDSILRKIIVTPDMHRIHHSSNREEHDSNYGFALSIWDRIFGTYRQEPVDGHNAMTIGLQWQNESPTKLGWSLWLPFRRK